MKSQHKERGPCYRVVRDRVRHDMSLHAQSSEQMIALGQGLGRCLAAGDVVGLVGELGAGKTYLSKGVGVGLGLAESIVTSPSFTLVNEYRGGRLILFHVDLYRLERPSDLEQIGLFDLYAAGGATVVEWFDRFAEAAPRDHLLVRIDASDDEARVLTLEPQGERAQALAAAWTASVAAPR